MQTDEMIAFRTSGIHGTGGFALRDIPEGTEIIEYLGRKIDK
ncbi:MAG: Nuclear protein, partial [Pedosphaera sp.]|nr:Nuclear protein [Pedosphaera sp.]